MLFSAIKKGVKKICPSPVWDFMSLQKAKFHYRNEIKLLKLRTGGG